jgi:chromosome segregation ATPase
MRDAAHILATGIVGMILVGCSGGAADWWSGKGKAASPSDGPKSSASTEEALRKQIQQLTIEKALKEEELLAENRKLKARLEDLEFLNRQKTKDLETQEGLLKEAKAYQGQAEVYKRQVEILQQKVANLETILNELQRKAPASRPAPGK